MTRRRQGPAWVPNQDRSHGWAWGAASERHRLETVSSAYAETGGTPNRNGGRHCCQPPLRRAKDLPVSKTRSEEHVIQALTHQLRRRFPSNHSLVRGASIFYSTALPEGSLIFQSPRLTRRSKPSDVPRPFLGRSLLRPALLFRPKTSEPRRARGRSTLPAPLPDWPRETPREFLIACRRRSVLPSPSASLLAVAGLPVEAGTSVPITCLQCTSAPSRKSEKYVIRPVDNGDIGNNSRNIS